MPDDTVMAWHFVGARLRDGRAVPPDGEWLEHEGPLVMCKRGLHASEHPSDALKYAPGPTLCRVECEGVELGTGDNADKLVCRRRRIVALPSRTCRQRSAALGSQGRSRCDTDRLPTRA